MQWAGRADEKPVHHGAGLRPLQARTHWRQQQQAAGAGAKASGVESPSTSSPSAAAAAAAAAPPEAAMDSPKLPSFRGGGERHRLHRMPSNNGSGSGINSINSTPAASPSYTNQASSHFSPSAAGRGYGSYKASVKDSLGEKKAPTFCMSLSVDEGSGCSI
jgi:hypothetical protein